MRHTFQSQSSAVNFRFQALIKSLLLLHWIRLGPRKLSLFEYGESFEFHQSIMDSFPRLADGGGYELLRTKQNTNRELCDVMQGSAPTETYAVYASIQIHKMRQHLEECSAGREH